MKKIKINREKCIGCLTCVSACVISNNSCDSRTRITIDSKLNNAPIFCCQCEKPECVYSCISGAMTKNPETGYVEYDYSKCAHCYMCVMACSFGVLKPDRVTKKEIMKCNLCVHRTDDNSPNPMCTEKCPMGAITFEEV